MTATARVDIEKTAVVLGAGAWGTIITTYRRYASKMHFHIDACPPRQPQTRGKVERRLRDQRDSHDPTGADWRDLAELQAWEDELSEKSARRRPYPVTGPSVWEAWQDEHALLGALPKTLPELFDAR